MLELILTLCCKFSNEWPGFAAEQRRQHARVISLHGDSMRNSGRYSSILSCGFMALRSADIQRSVPVGSIGAFQAHRWWVLTSDHPQKSFTYQNNLPNLMKPARMPRCLRRIPSLKPQFTPIITWEPESVMFLIPGPFCTLSQTRPRCSTIA